MLLHLIEAQGVFLQKLVDDNNKKAEKVKEKLKEGVTCTADTHKAEVAEGWLDECCEVCGSQISWRAVEELEARSKGREHPHVPGAWHQGWKRCREALKKAREALGGADVGEVVDEDAQDPFAGRNGRRRNRDQVKQASRSRDGGKARKTSPSKEKEKREKEKEKERAKQRDKDRDKDRQRGAFWMLLKRQEKETAKLLQGSQAELQPPETKPVQEDQKEKEEKEQQQFQKRYPGMNTGPVEAMPAMPSDMFQERQVFDRLQMPTMQSVPTNFVRAPGGTEVFQQHQQHQQPRMDQVMPNGHRNFGQAPNAGFRPLGSQDGFSKMLPISQETPGYVLNGQFQNLPQAAPAPSKAVYLQHTNIPTPFNCFLIGGDSPKDILPILQRSLHAFLMNASECSCGCLWKWRMRPKSLFPQDVKVASPTSPGGFIQAFPLMPLQQERQAQPQVVPVLQPSQLPQQPMSCSDQE
eukprot:s4386_g5.t1